jgi:hypothetical protein
MEGIMGYGMGGAEAGSGGRGASACWLVAEFEPEWDAEGSRPEGEPEDQQTEGEAGGQEPGGASKSEQVAEEGWESGQNAESNRDSESESEPEPSLSPALRLLIEAGIERGAAEALTTIDPNGSAPLTSEQSDAVEVVGDAIRSLAVQLAAAEHRMLVLIAAFDRHGGWKPGAHRDCAHWLSFFTGMDLGTARQRLRTAHALTKWGTKLPVVSAAMSRGELSYSKARAIGRLEEELQSEEAQEAWVELAVKVSAHELESRVRMARQLHGRTEEELERARLRRRRFSIFPDENGMYELRGKVTADVGQMLMQVIEAASDVLFHADGRDWSPNGDGRTVRIEEIKPQQRRADALWLIAERIMEVGFEGEEAAEADETAIAEVAVPAETESSVPAESDVRVPTEADTPVSAEPAHTTCSDHTPTRCCPPRRRPGMPKMSADRYKVHLFVDERALSGEDEAQPSYFVDGVRIPPEMARRLSCCGPVTEIRRARNGTLLDVQVKSRMPPKWMQTALLHRDGGCRFPGCGANRVKFHHIVLWQHGGKTIMSNLICLCPFHHRGVHEGGFRVKLFADGRALFTDRAGMPIPDSAPPPRMVNPLDALLAQNQSQWLRSDPMRAAKYRVHRSGDRDSVWQIEARALDGLGARSLDPSEARPLDSTGARPLDSTGARPLDSTGARPLDATEGDENGVGG